VRGKGNKIRFRPLAPEATQLLDHYLRLERPANSATALFVSLKGPARGARMTPAGLRSLFRTGSARMRSPNALARAAWAKCIALPIPGWGATWPSRSESSAARRGCRPVRGDQGKGGGSPSQSGAVSCFLSAITGDPTRHTTFEQATADHASECVSGAMYT
jgi:hypothetical protein